MLRRDRRNETQLTHSECWIILINKLCANHKFFFSLFWLLLLSYKYTQFIQQVFLSLKSVCKQNCRLHYMCSSFVTLISSLRSVNLNSNFIVSVLTGEKKLCFEFPCLFLHTIYCFTQMFWVFFQKKKDKQMVFVLDSFQVWLTINRGIAFQLSGFPLRCIGKTWTNGCQLIK